MFFFIEFNDLTLPKEYQDKIIKNLLLINDILEVTFDQNIFKIILNKKENNEDTNII